MQKSQSVCISWEQEPEPEQDTNQGEMNKQGIFLAQS